MSAEDLAEARRLWSRMRKVVTPHTAGGRWGDFVKLGHLLGIPEEETEKYQGI